jgi:hypothetical protein
MTKATTAEGDDIRYSHNWVVSRRGILRVTTEGWECGNWYISYSDIQETVLFSTRQMFISDVLQRTQRERKDVLLA